VLKFISKLVETYKTFLAKGDIYLASDIAFISIFRNCTSNFSFKIYGRTEQTCSLDVIEFSTNQKAVNFLFFNYISVTVRNLD